MSTFPPGFWARPGFSSLTPVPSPEADLCHNVS